MTNLTPVILNVKIDNLMLKKVINEDPGADGPGIR
jgi:hypothetical protein